MGKIENSEGITVWKKRKVTRKKGERKNVSIAVETKERRKANILDVEDERKRGKREGKMKRSVLIEGKRS